MHRQNIIIINKILVEHIQGKWAKQKVYKSMKDLTVLKPFSEEDYNKLLRQAVAVIETSRLQIAKQLNAAVMSSYWEIGKLLEEKKIDSKYGDSIVKRLSVDLKSKYPDMGLSPRNLWDMKKIGRASCRDRVCLSV